MTIWCRRFDSTCRRFDHGCRRLGLSPFWLVAVLDLSPFWLSPFWICRRYDQYSKAVNILVDVNPNENLDGEKKDEGEPATNGGQVVGSTGSVAGVGSTVRGGPSTVAARTRRRMRTRRRTRTKRRHCSVKTSGENANTCDAYGKSLRSDNSSKVHI